VGPNLRSTEIRVEYSEKLAELKYGDKAKAYMIDKYVDDYRKELENLEPKTPNRVFPKHTAPNYTEGSFTKPVHQQDNLNSNKTEEITEINEYFKPVEEASKRVLFGRVFPQTAEQPARAHPQPPGGLRPPSAYAFDFQTPSVELIKPAFFKPTAEERDPSAPSHVFTQGFLGIPLSTVQGAPQDHDEIKIQDEPVFLSKAHAPCDNKLTEAADPMQEEFIGHSTEDIAPLNRENEEQQGLSTNVNENQNALVNDLKIDEKTPIKENTMTMIQENQGSDKENQEPQYVENQENTDENTAAPKETHEISKIEKEPVFAEENLDNNTMIIEMDKDLSNRKYSQQKKTGRKNTAKKSADQIKLDFDHENYNPSQLLELTRVSELTIPVMNSEAGQQQTLEQHTQVRDANEAGDIALNSQTDAKEGATEENNLLLGLNPFDDSETKKDNVENSMPIETQLTTQQKKTEKEFAKHTPMKLPTQFGQSHQLSSKVGLNVAHAFPAKPKPSVLKFNTGANEMKPHLNQSAAVQRKPMFGNVRDRQTGASLKQNSGEKKAIESSPSKSALEMAKERIKNRNAESAMRVMSSKATPVHFQASNVSDVKPILKPETPRYVKPSFSFGNGRDTPTVFAKPDSSTLSRNERMPPNPLLLQKKPPIPKFGLLNNSVQNKMAPNPSKDLTESARKPAVPKVSELIKRKPLQKDTLSRPVV
jgi:hypothetical protein